MKKLIAFALCTLAIGSTISAMNVEQEITNLKAQVVLLTTIVTQLTAAGKRSDITHEKHLSVTKRILDLDRRILELDRPTQKIITHPATWLSLIVVYYLASKYYERRQKKKDESDPSPDQTNSDTEDSKVVN